MTPPRLSTYAGGVNLLEDPGRYYWKWIAITVALLVLYAIERTIRLGVPF